MWRVGHGGNRQEIAVGIGVIIQDGDDYGGVFGGGGCVISGGRVEGYIANLDGHGCGVACRCVARLVHERVGTGESGIGCVGERSVCGE